MVTRKQIEELRRLCQKDQEFPHDWATRMWNLAVAGVFQDLINLYDATAELMPDTPWRWVQEHSLWTRSYRTYRLIADEHREKLGHRAVAANQVLYADSLEEAMRAAERVIDQDFFGT